MKPSIASRCVQREHHYAIVDEVDSILIDEARTPLIISGQSEQNTDIYRVANQVIPRSEGREGGSQDRRARDRRLLGRRGALASSLTDAGRTHKVEKLLRVENLYDPQMLPVLHAVNQALIAHSLKKRDVDYVVQPGESGKPEVVIVDEFTGRLMPGRRWSRRPAPGGRGEGRHRDPEREPDARVDHVPELLPHVRQALGHDGNGRHRGARVRQDLRPRRDRGAHQPPMVRDDLPDVVYKSEREKFDAVIGDIKERHETGQPVLVGTISIENSERLAKRLKKKGVKHNVLNAKQHEREAEIVAQAGRKGGRDDLDQHGRPRHRHPARRQPRGRWRSRSAAATPTRPSTRSCWRVRGPVRWPSATR